MKKKDTELMEKGWQQMQVILDKEMPTTRRRLVGVYWWLAASLLIGSSVGYYRLRQMPTQAQQLGIATLTPEAASRQNLLKEQSSVQTTVAGTSSAASQASDAQVIERQSVSNILKQTSQIAVVEQTTSQPHQLVTEPTSTLSEEELSASSQPVLANETLLHVLTPLSTLELPEKINNHQAHNAELLATPVVMTARREKWQLGIGAALGSSLVPTPSSAQLNLDARYFLRSGLQLGVAFGAQYTSFKGNQTVLVEVPSALLQDADASPAVVDYLSASADEGHYPALTKAFYYQVGASVHQRLNSFWLAGLSAQYFRLTQAQLSSSNLEASVLGNTAGFDPDLQADVTKTLDHVGSQLLAKNSWALQAQISRQINRDFQVSLGLRAFVTKGYPDPMSVQLGCVYSPLHF